MIDVPVLIAGGGPVGLVLAHELRFRGIRALLVERNPTTTRHPKMDVTNGRSLEHFRRLGIARAVRAAAVPEDHPMDVIWVTRAAEYEVARFAYPSVIEAREIIHRTNDGSLPLEPYMRISQVVLEPVLKELLERDASDIEVRFGWGLESFAQDSDGVTAVIRETATRRTETVRCAYLAGCDGGGSTARKQLDIQLEGQSGVADIFMIHFRSRALDVLQKFGVSWHVQSPIGGTLIAQDDREIWTLHTPLPPGVDGAASDPKALLFQCLGAAIDCEILVANMWTPHLLVAEQYGAGRVWLAGDAVHQYIPTGGYGMNTGVGDAVDLGWKLAARLQGWGGPRLLESYEAERRPIGLRNREASQRHMGVRLKILFDHYDACVHEDSPAGAAARRALGQGILALGNAENESLGIEIGYRYDNSPIICGEDGEAPPADALRYTPSTWPGVRVPSLFLADGSALFDRFGPGFTLVRFADRLTEAFERAARERGVPLHVLDVREPRLHAIYQRALVLVRPDQHVAWRGDAVPGDAVAIIDRVRGAA